LGTATTATTVRECRDAVFVHGPPPSGIGANICVADEIRNFILSRTFGTEPEERISLTGKTGWNDERHLFGSSLAGSVATTCSLLPPVQRVSVLSTVNRHHHFELTVNSRTIMSTMNSLLGRILSTTVSATIRIWVDEFS